MLIEKIEVVVEKLNTLSRLLRDYGEYSVLMSDFQDNDEALNIVDWDSLRERYGRGGKVCHQKYLEIQEAISGYDSSALVDSSRKDTSACNKDEDRFRPSPLYDRVCRSSLS